MEANLTAETITLINYSGGGAVVIAFVALLLRGLFWAATKALAGAIGEL